MADTGSRCRSHGLTNGAGAHTKSVMKGVNHYVEPFTTIAKVWQLQYWESMAIQPPYWEPMAVQPLQL